MRAPNTALVVDDEVQLLRLVVRVLERADWKARTAETKADALQIFREYAEEIDLVLLDVNLSGDGGAEELLPLLLETKPALGVLVMSGDALPDSLAERLASVGGAFLRKPFSPKALMRLLDDFGIEDEGALQKEPA